MQFYDIAIGRGETLRRIVKLKKNGQYIDLTGYQAKSQVRETPDGGTLICEISTTIDTEENQIILTIADNVTAGIVPGVYAWDLRVTLDSDIVKYYVGGKFTVLPTVTE